MTKRPNPHAKALSNPLFKPQTVPTKKYDPATDPNSSDFMEECYECGGTGVDPAGADLGWSDDEPCPICGGTGEIPVWFQR